MIPVHELLARIRWDADFAKARFFIGYWDRIAGAVIRVDPNDIAWDRVNPPTSIWWMPMGWRTTSRSNGAARFGEIPS